MAMLSFLVCSALQAQITEVEEQRKYLLFFLY
jgi:hypothetical protein